MISTWLKTVAFAAMVSALPMAAEAVTVTKVTIASQNGAIFVNPAVPGNTNRVVDVISFSRPVDYATFTRNYLYEYDYYAWNDASRTGYAEVFPFGNESPTSGDAVALGSGLYGSRYPREFSQVMNFDRQQSPLEAAFPFGGFVVTQQNYRSALLDAGTFDGREFVATITTYADVPEPATWMMMIGGIGAAGATLRRQRRRIRASVAFA